MLYSALSWVLLAAFPGGSGDGLRRDLASDEAADVETGDAASDDESASPGVLAPSLSFEDLQAPPPQNPPPPPPPPKPETHVVVVEPPYPVTFSLYGRIPFPLGAVRFGVPGGGATEQRVRYDDLFKEHGYGGGAEIAFLKSSTEREDVEPRDQEGHPRPPVRPVDRHAGGLYLAGEFDAFHGDTVATAAGTLKADHMDTESMFIGYKDHEPWGGGGFFTEFRVGGGAIHYGSVHATLGSAGLELFRNTWGPAGEVAGRLGLNLGGSLTIFIGGQGFAAQGPRPGKNLPLTADTNTFFVAAAEAGLEFGF